MRIANILGALAFVAGAHAAPSFAQTKGVTIQPDRLPGMCVALAGPDGASISLPCDGSDRQDFILPETGKPGLIMQDAQCMAVKDDNNYPPMMAEACDGSPEQTWTVGAEGTLKNGVGRCLSLLGASSRTGAMVYGGRCPREEQFAHQWRFKTVDSTNVIEASLESSARPGMCIGHGTQLDLLPCSDSYGQIISFDQKALGQMRLKSSCFSGGYVFGSLGLGECHNNPAQMWAFLPDGSIGNAKAECIEVVNENGRDVLRTTVCAFKPEQQWIVRMPPAAAQ